MRPQWAGVYHTNLKFPQSLLINVIALNPEVNNPSATVVVNFISVSLEPHSYRLSEPEKKSSGIT